MSVYEMQGLLLRLGRTVNSATRWRGAELARLTTRVSQQVTDLLAEARGLASLFLRTDLSPWTGATLADGEAVQKALDLVQQMHNETLPQCLASLYAFVAQTGLKRPTALAKTTDFFKNSVTKLAPDGSIRFFVDIGQEAQFSVNTATEAASIRFAATATEDTQGGDNYKNAEVRAVFGGARQVRIRLTGPSWAASAI